MEKTHATIEKKEKSIPLDVEADAGKLYMHNASLWVYLWANAYKIIEEFSGRTEGQSDKIRIYSL